MSKYPVSPSERRRRRRRIMPENIFNFPYIIPNYPNMFERLPSINPYMYASTSMDQDRAEGPEQSTGGNENVRDSEPMPPPPSWVGASGRVSRESTPSGRRTPRFLDLTLNTPMLSHPIYSPQRQVVIPRPSIVGQPMTVLANLPQSPPRDLNAPRGPPPQSMHMRILTGSINHIVEWTDNIQGVPLFEVTGFLHGFAMVNPVFPPAAGNEINLLLRDRRDSGPILQVIQPYHLFPEMLQGIQTGQVLRCVGKVLDARRMLAIKITIVPPNAVIEVKVYLLFIHCIYESSNMSQGRSLRSQSATVNGTASDSEVMPPPIRRLANRESLRRRNPLSPVSSPLIDSIIRPTYPAPRRIRIPHPSIIHQPIKLFGNLTKPQSPPRDSNTLRSPPPTSMHMQILTGSINQIREWTQNAQDMPIYEVTGYLFSFGMVNPTYPPAPGNEVNLLLRDHRHSGPILRVIHQYHLFSEMPRGLQPGQVLRCVGKILDSRRMLAIKITIVPPNSEDNYGRVGNVCRFTE